MHNVSNGSTGEALSDPVDTLVAAQAAFCPMLTLVRAYEAERERYEASDDISDTMLFWMRDRLTKSPPPVYTQTGARAALRLAANDMDGGTSGFQKSLVAAVLAFQQAEGAWSRTVTER